MQDGLSRVPSWFGIGGFAGAFAIFGGFDAVHAAALEDLQGLWLRAEMTGTAPGYLQTSSNWGYEGLVIKSDLQNQSLPGHCSMVTCHSCETIGFKGLSCFSVVPVRA